MADVTITPNMNLPVPVPSVAPGPAWATSVVACMSAIDAHTHTSGQGVPITPAAININADLYFGSFNATGARSVNFTSQSAALALPTDLGCIYVVDADLYYNDEAGNQIRITQGGAVAGSTGTITGLPSGTASASYSAGTFTFQSATSTPATMALGPLVIGAAVASSKTVTLAPPNTLAANYALTFPAALPASTSVVTIDSSGNMATTLGPALTSPTITTPTFAGAPAGTISASTYTPTRANVVGTATVTASSFCYFRIGNRVTVNGNVTGTTGVGGALQYTLTLPIDPTSNFASAAQVTGGAFVTTTSSALIAFIATATTGAKTATITITNVGGSPGISAAHNVYFTYDCA